MYVHMRVRVHVCVWGGGGVHWRDSIATTTSADSWKNSKGRHDDIGEQRRRPRGPPPRRRQRDDIGEDRQQAQKGTVTTLRRRRPISKYNDETPRRWLFFLGKIKEILSYKFGTRRSESLAQAVVRAHRVQRESISSSGPSILWVVRVVRTYCVSRKCWLCVA